MSCTAFGVDWKCDRVAFSKQLCRPHYDQRRNGKIPLRKLQIAETVIARCPGCGSDEPKRIHSTVYCQKCERSRQLERKYGITHEGYEELLAKQGGRCAICGTDSPGKFHVDHDHDKPVGQAVRSILCSECNTGLGKFKDSSDMLAKASAYLKSHGK